MKKEVYQSFAAVRMVWILLLLLSFSSYSQDMSEGERRERCRNNQNRITELISQLRVIDAELSGTMTTRELEVNRNNLVSVRKLKKAESWNPIAVQRIASVYNFNIDDCIVRNRGKHLPSNICVTALETIITDKIDKALSLENKKPYLLGKKTELGRQLTEHQNNLIALGCNQVSGAEGNTGGCFSSDPAMASTNRNDHYNWAQTQDGTRLDANMKSKINLLNICPSINNDDFANTFAGLSAIIAKYAQKITAFNNDPGAANTDASAHYNWAKNQSREQLLQNLQWKMGAAFKSLNSIEQKTIFADMSALIGQSAQGNQTSGNTGVNNNNRGSTRQGSGEWKVWVRVTPCSGRFDWISVAKENPSGGGNFFYPANQLFPGTTCTTDGCTFEEATTVANILRTSPQFSNYCCKDYSVFKNSQTGKFSVVLGKFGSPGFGWDLVKPGLCCEEAEALAGIPGACSGTTDNNHNPPNIKCPPGSHAAWNAQTKKTECYCDAGLFWNSTKTACVKPEVLVAEADCSKYPGSYAAWNAQTQKVECWCPEGKIWNSTMTACIDDPAKVKCPPGSSAQLNSQTQKTECYCNPGLYWNRAKTACVTPEELKRETNCSAYPGSYADWNEEKKLVECYCPDGKVWNATMTACIDDPAKAKCWPGSYAAVNPQTQKTECYCNPGLVWNSTKTACVDPKVLVAEADCSKYPGSYAAWNAQLQKVECYCPTGYVWNSTRTACVQSTPDCNSYYPNSEAKWNPQKNAYECYCKTGYEWNSTRTACVQSSVDCNSYYPNSEAKWNAQTNMYECDCKTGYQWNAARTACVAITTTTNDGGGGGSGTWTLVSVIVSPQTPNTGWSYSAQSSSANLTIYNGDKADFQWTPPPQQFNSAGFTISLNTTAKPVPKSRMSTLIGVAGTGLTSNMPSDQQLATANAEGGASASGQKSVTFKPVASTTDIEVRIGIMWGSVNFVYKYKKM